jgi:hypothetical protein
LSQAAQGAGFLPANSPAYSDAGCTTLANPSTIPYNTLRVPPGSSQLLAFVIQLVVQNEMASRNLPSVPGPTPPVPWAPAGIEFV